MADNNSTQMMQLPVPESPHRVSRNATQSMPAPSVSPTGLAASRPLQANEFDEDEEKELTPEERLLRSPTDKLLSPVSRALRAHHKRSPNRVRTSLASLLDVAL